MPLRKGYSRSIISSNIRELHTGATFAHTEGKFGKKRADSQAVAIALDVARKAKRRRRADGGGLWGDIGAAMPEAYGAQAPIVDPLITIPKRLIWDLPHEAIDAAVNAPPLGVHREDYTEESKWGEPDPNSLTSRLGLSLPAARPDPMDPMIGASLEAATNVMGGTALSAPAATAGEVVAGAGPTLRAARAAAPRAAEAAPALDQVDQILQRERGATAAPVTPTVDWAHMREIEGSLSPETARSLDNWVGGPMSTMEDMKKGAHPGFGIFNRNALTPEIQDQLAQAYQPLRNYLREAYGDTIQLHRYRGDIPEGATPHDVLSFTNNRGVAEGLSGARPERPIYDDAYIKQKEQEFAQNGRVDVGKGRWLENANETVWNGKENVPVNYIAIMGPDGMVTDTGSVREYLEKANQWNREDNANRAAALANVKDYHIPVDDVLAATNRFGQQEFIVKNRSAILGSGASDKRAAGAAGLDELDQILAREKAGATHEPAPTAGAEGPAAADPGEVGPGGGGPAGARSLPEAQAAAARWAGARTPLEGLPGPMKIGDDYFVPGPIGKVHDVAEQYMRENRPEIDFKGADKVHPIDPEHSQAIAQAYDEMKHSPKDPATEASYDALINETQKQYQAIKDSGLKIEPIPPNMPDPYAANPRLAAKDVAENNHLWFFPTENGFGTLKKIGDNPMLRKTGEKIGDHEMLANDMFRVVHDYFGHLQHVHGFRAAGEDNAWRSHSAMYSDLARPAMTTETRGQNSWVNYGPHGEANRTASGANTVYADQKVGLMPDWTMYDRGKEPIYAYHGSPHSFDRFSMDKIGTGEGAQAYGHGLYFAENPKVAKAYRDQLSAGQAYEKNGQPVQWTDVADDLVKAAKGAQSLHPDQSATIVDRITRMIEDGKSVKQIRKAYDAPAGFEKAWNAALEAAGKYTYNKRPGHSYKVAIEANPEHFLDWDKPLSQQPHIAEMIKRSPSYQRLAASQKFGYDPDEFAKLPPERQKHLIDQLTPESHESILYPEQRGHHLLTQLAKKNVGGYGEFDYPAATEKLREAGVEGIKYHDQGSRKLAQGAKSHNYVAFNDKTVRILRKYGIAGVPAAGAAAGAMRDNQQRASGGGVNKAIEVARRIKRAKGGAVHVGPIVGNTGGRADEVPMEVPDGSYVLTADHCSAMGQGNTLAGFEKLKKMFPKSAAAFKAAKAAGPKRRASGGRVPIYAAHGEFVICPEDIKDRFGDLDHGHKVLDHWQTMDRQKHIDTLSKLAPPAQD